MRCVRDRIVALTAALALSVAFGLGLAEYEQIRTTEVNVVETFAVPVSVPTISIPTISVPPDPISEVLKGSNEKIRDDRWYLAGPLTSGDVLGLGVFLQRARTNDLDEITIEINSQGGGVMLAHLLAKLIEDADADGIGVTCVADGMAASAAFYILQACPVRVMTKRTVLMAHHPRLTEVSVEPHEADNVRSSLRAFARAFAEHCAARLVGGIEEYLRHVDDGREWWMDWREAETSGAVDRVVKSSDDLY